VSSAHYRNHYRFPPAAFFPCIFTISPLISVVVFSLKFSLFFFQSERSSFFFPDYLPASPGEGPFDARIPPFLRTVLGMPSLMDRPSEDSGEG